MKVQSLDQKQQWFFLIMAQGKDVTSVQLSFQRDVLITVPEDLLQSIPESLWSLALTAVPWTKPFTDLVAFSLLESRNCVFYLRFRNRTPWPFSCSLKLWKFYSTCCVLRIKSGWPFQGLKEKIAESFLRIEGHPVSLLWHWTSEVAPVFHCLP